MLTGGELAALVVIDAVTRLLPGAIDDASTVEESFSAGLLEYPQYTRPAEFRGQGVPDVLVSGHHEAVRALAPRARPLERTQARRPGPAATASELSPGAATSPDDPVLSFAAVGRPSRSPDRHPAGAAARRTPAGRPPP